MTSSKYSSLFMALSLPVLGCASATLQVPNDGAANPEAPTMPVAQNEGVLAKDFDPWADDASVSEPHAHHHDPDAHHHQPMTEPAHKPASSTPQDTSEQQHRHEVHGHE